MKKAALGVLLVLLAGCNKFGVKGAIEARRAEVQANLDRVTKIGASLATLPPVTIDAVTVATPVVFVAASKDEPLPTATLIHAEDIAELAAPVPHADRLSDTTLLSECASLLTKGKHVSPSNPNVFENVVKSYLDKCKSIKTLFVVRTRKKESRAFEGDVVAFDLASGKHLGGFALSVTSAGRTAKVTNTTTTVQRTSAASRRRRVIRTTTTTESYQNDDEAQLRSDLADAIDAGITKTIPSATLVE
ncbi:MAG: hypothetical protein KF819_27995 [Labilithrix sp.]|nr:hypothetical protein [Labilithrix sp.]